jgi:Putative adhesin
MNRAGAVSCAFVLLLAGCGANGVGIVEQIVEHSYKIELNARLSIHNLDGSIHIYGANAAEIKVQAIKKAYSADRLDKISVEVTVEPGVVAIETKYPPRPRWGLSDRSGTVDYIIVLPSSCSISQLELGTGEVLVEGMRGENVHARLVNGRMLGHNCFGDLHFAVTNGGLDVAYDWWEKRKFSIDAEIVNGNARAFVPGHASFHLLATSTNGDVANEFSEKQDRHSDETGKIDTTIGGRSEVDLRIHATNGNIKIAEANL